jgi:tetratricopeptide (TPR) repeat protein
VFLGLIPVAIFFKSEVSLKKNVLITLILVSISGLVLFLRFKAIGNVIDKGDYLFVWNPLLDAPNVGVRLATAFGVFLKTVLLLFFPINLSWDYSFNEIPFSSWSEPFTILAFLLYLSLLIIAIVGIKKRNNFSFAIWFYLIASIITSNLLFACPIIFSERGQFISSLGFCLIFPFLIAYILKDKDFITNLVLGKNIRIVIIIVLVLFSIKTIYRSADWKSDETLYLSGVKTSPNSCRTHYSLANLYYDRIANATTNEEKQENLNLAIHEYRKALDIYPAYRQLYYNLGVAYFYKNNFDSSAYMYEKALSFDSADLRTVTNYAYLLFLKKDFKKSLDLYNRAIGLPEGKNLPVLYIGAGLCYRGLLDYNNAKLKFEMALKIQPGNKQAQNSLLELESIKK